MSCGGSAKDGVATCVCSGQTVFEGAVIGQVFTGDVQMQCPHADHAERIALPESGRPIASAMLAIAIWHAWLAIPLVDVAGAGPSLPQAVLFLMGGLLLRYWPKHRRTVAGRRERSRITFWMPRNLPPTHWK